MFKPDDGVISVLEYCWGLVKCIPSHYGEQIAAFPRKLIFDFNGLVFCLFLKLVKFFFSICPMIGLIMMYSTKCNHAFFYFSISLAGSILAHNIQVVLAKKVFSVIGCGLMLIPP